MARTSKEVVLVAIKTPDAPLIGGGQGRPPRNTGETPVVRTSNKTMIGPALVILSGLGIVLLCLGVLANNLYGTDEDAERATRSEELRSDAENILKARFNDTNPNVGELVDLKVTWTDSQLVVDFTLAESDKIQKQCHAPVITNDDFTQFGFEPIPVVEANQIGTVSAWCFTPQPSVYGLPIG